MAWPIVVAWIHYVSIMLMTASLLAEHLILKAEMTATQARTVQRLDMIYGITAGLVLVTGIARMYLEKGPTYYLQNGAFHALVGVFILVGLLSVYPTVFFLRWRAATNAGKGQLLVPGQFRTLQMIMRTEMALVLLAPFFATWMAHGPLF